MKNGKRLAALVINWNGAEDTIELLCSLCRCQSENIAINAVIVDNASTRDDRAKLESALGEFDGRLDIRFRANNVNVGVPAAYNQAIQIAGLNYDYYLRLDNDVVVEPDGLLKMIETLQQGADEGIAIVGGNIRYFDRRTENNGGAVSIDLVKGRTTIAYPSSDVACDAVLGCIMLFAGDLVRRYAPEVFQSALFIFTDESELSLRAARDGMRTAYVASVIGFHKSGRSTRKVNFISNYYSARNWTLLRLGYVQTGPQKLSVLMRIPLDVARSLVRRRWAFPLGAVAGLGLAVTSFLDRGVRRGNCRW